MTSGFDFLRSELVNELHRMRKQVVSNEDVVFNYNLDNFIDILNVSVDYYQFVNKVEKLFPEIFKPLYKKALGNIEWMEKSKLVS